MEESLHSNTVNKCDRRTDNTAVAVHILHLHATHSMVTYVTAILDFQSPTISPCCICICMPPCHNCLHPFGSSLCSPWRPCCPSNQATSRQPGILRRWSYGEEQLAARHSNCFVFNHIQEPTQDSLIHPVLLYNVIFEYCMLYGALVVTLWTCYGALQIVVLLLLLLTKCLKKLKEN